MGVQTKKVGERKKNGSNNIDFQVGKECHTITCTGAHYSFDQDNDAVLNKKKNKE